MSFDSAQTDVNNTFENLETAPKYFKKTINSTQLESARFILALSITLLPLLGVLLAIYFLFEGHSIDIVEIGLLFGMSILTTTGITIGFHRYCAHHSFETTTPIKFLLLILGSMATQGPMIYWVSVHRRHHENSDQNDDPHSPHLECEGKLALLRGLWYAHIGWMFKHKIPNSAYYASDLMRDKLISKLNQLYFLWIFLSLAIPTILGGALKGSFEGAFYGFLWGGVVRVFVVQHITFSVNSFAHVFGNRMFASQDSSKNNFVLAIPTLGESWHNNHHTFPSSAIFGLKWWQIDISGWIIFGLEKVGLAWNVKYPTTRMIEAKLSPKV
ncbi:MAG: acyl-CoA desaturase [Crinalium sp.]